MGERKGGDGTSFRQAGTGVSNLDSRRLGWKHIQKIELRQLSPTGRGGKGGANVQGRVKGPGCQFQWRLQLEPELKEHVATLSPGTEDTRGSLAPHTRTGSRLLAEAGVSGEPSGGSNQARTADTEPEVEVDRKK